MSSESVDDSTARSELGSSTTTFISNRSNKTKGTEQANNNISPLNEIEPMAKGNVTLPRRSNKSSKGVCHLSLLWFVLIVGVFICVFDCVYMLNVMHRKEGGMHAEKQHKKAQQLNSLERGMKERIDQKERKKIEDKNDKSNHLDSGEHDGKQPLIDLMKEAGVTYLDKSTYDDLPTWKEITDLYGTKPRIEGLDTCQKFQNTGDKADHFIGTAGTFNSGTNLLSEYLIANCHMKPRMEKFGRVNRGIRWQVPWGKHSPPGDNKFRLEHKSKKDKNVGANDILPAVMVRDPYKWMQSMCRHPYAAKWAKSADLHCPNLVPTFDDRAAHTYLKKVDSMRVRVKYSEFERKHDSLIHFWNDWYNEYLNMLEIPRLIIRYEDLLFFPKETITTACECAGGSIIEGKPFEYIVDSAKKGDAAHGKMEDRTGYIDALIRYGTEDHRYEGYTDMDLEYVQNHINKEFATRFGYKLAPEITRYVATTDTGEKTDEESDDAKSESSGKSDDAVESND